MAEYATKKDVENIVKTAVDDLSNVINQFAFQVDERFNALDMRIIEIEKSLNRLTNTIDGFVKRLDDMETDNTARDVQYERLLKWAKKVSAKTGIPIEL